MSSLFADESRSQNRIYFVGHLAGHRAGWLRGGSWMRILLVLSGLLAPAAAGQPDETAIRMLQVRACDDQLPVCVALPPGLNLDDEQAWDLHELDAQEAAVIPIDRVPEVAADGTAAEPRGALMALIPPATSDSLTRQFTLVPRTSTEISVDRTNADFRWETQGENALHLSQNGQPVLTYNYGPVTDETVPANDSRRVRACYVHPLWGLEGETLTADFPRDHFHHHGLFWAWKHITVGDETYDSWERPNIEVRFRRWLGATAERNRPRWESKTAGMPDSR